ncbi:hypothetical protein PROFUN_02257 [Planoprotostelium fungivorum]|uniref:Cytosolic Fe-S cluster assembly factor NUBP2 homolog n=1 Tax=Planoprotostelium fungivorum TaxID=1890364 RepID=A0A2P6NYF5_9EUKA|nr:hypothetical protein PROFUN_02257 [Planoprotostelium fungivorum]
MEGVKHKILVLSGKGGVGKSTVSCQLALALVLQGKKVGLLDVDLCGPSVPRIVGLQGRDVKKSNQGWIPVYPEEHKSLAVMSIGFLLPDPDAAVVWRGPKKTAMIKQFIEDVVWGELDYLIVDTPPGTSDEHIAVIESLKEHQPDGAVIVTTPQGVSISDVRKEISFCNKVGLPILGVVENMSGFICPNCSECTNIFSSEGGKLLSEELNIRFLGKIPIDPALTALQEGGGSFVSKFPDSQTLKAIQLFVSDLITSPTPDAK